MKPGDSQPPAPRDFDWLSNIIKALNETFGIDLTDEDKVELSRLRERIDNITGTCGVFYSAECA